MKYLLLLTFTFSSSIFSQNYNLEWVKSLSGSLDVIIRDHKVDSNNNLFITGNFIGSVDFDPSLNSYILTTPSSTSNNNSDIFIAKYNSEGNLLWAKQLIGSGIADYGLSIEIDTVGNIYTTGYFSQSVDFNPSPTGYYSITVNGFPHTFILKLDNNGNFIWAKHAEGNSSSIGHKLKIHNNNIYLAGTFYGNTDFDFSNNNNILSTNSIHEDGFIAKYSLNGDFFWAKKYGGANTKEYILDVNFDNNDNIILSGYLDGFSSSGNTLINGVISVPFFGGTDALILKCDNNGELIWAKSLGSFNNDYAVQTSIDINNNTFTSGSFTGNVDFNDNSNSSFMMSASNRNGYLLKLDENGNFINAIKIGGNNVNQCSKSTLFDDKIIISGTFSGSADFDPSNQNFQLLSSGQFDIFLLSLDTNLNFLNVNKINGNGNEFGTFSLVNNFLYVTGGFNNITNFNLSGSNNSISPVGNYDSFIAKYNPGFLNQNEFSFFNTNIYPNPFIKNLSIEGNSIESLTVYDLYGKIILEHPLNEINTFDFSSFTNGVYYLKIKHSNNNFEYVKIIKSTH